MQAAVTWASGDAFDVRDDVERRAVAVDEVVVRIRAAGVCQTDISLSHGQFGQPTPVVLGHEGAGEVIEVGPGVTGVGVGDRVVLTWVPRAGGGISASVVRPTSARIESDRPKVPAAPSPPRGALSSTAWARPRSPRRP